MKLFHVIFISVILGAGLVSCSKEQDEVSTASPQEIVLLVDDCSMDMAVETRTTAVSQVPTSLYWSATTGTLGTSETSKWSSAQASVSSGKISTGKYQTLTPTSYNYYLSNVAITFGSTGSTVTADGAQTDVIVGKATSNNGTTSITMDHVFARTGSLTCNTQEGYEISNVSWKIVGKSNINGTKGTYNIAKGQFTAASTKLGTATAITSSSDKYLIPGTYTVSVTYTLKKGDNYSTTLTKSGDVTLQAGKVNNISCTAVGGSATPVDFNVSLNDWGSNDINVNFS